MSTYPPAARRKRLTAHAEQIATDIFHRSRCSPLLIDTLTNILERVVEQEEWHASKLTKGTYYDN